jgi:hypothetical protein
MSQLDPVAIGTTQVTIGNSQVLRLTATNFETFSHVKYVSGGSLEILKPQLSGSSTAAGGSFKTLGYLLGSTEVFNLNSAKAFYMGTSGSTPAIAHLAINLTSGVTLA